MNKEIVIIMGFQGAGKSSLVKQYEDKGYTRANRDEMGGSLNALNMKVEGLMRKGVDKFVLDNTYGTKMARFEVLELAKRNGFLVKCVWLMTKLEDAQFNVCSRILNKFVMNEQNPPAVNAILGPNGSKLIRDPANIPSIAIYAYKKNFEKPEMSEGFSEIEKVEFVRKPLPPEYKNKAIILDYDGTLRKTKSGNKYPVSPDDIVILPNRNKVLTSWIFKGYYLLGVSNQSGIEKGDLDEKTAIACFDQTNKLLGFNIDYQFCPHHSFPIRCYCRKPLAGLGVYLIEKYKLNPSECIMVGDSTSDGTFASRCGFKYMEQDKFFA